MRLISYLILLFIIFVGLTFASLNSMPVAFNYYLGSKTISLSLLLVFAFGFGILFGLLSSTISYIKIKKDYLSVKSRLKIAEKEIENLRSIPIKDE